MPGPVRPSRPFERFEALAKKLARVPKSDIKRNKPKPDPPPRTDVRLH